MATSDSSITTESKSWHDFMTLRAFKTLTSIGDIAPGDELDVLTSGLLGRPPPDLGKGTEEEHEDEGKKKRERKKEEAIST
ncbi:hypothetical protein BHE74_00031257 [Ensete ventricosum]|nr:hypothetical protein BHE74_00031257 [Ensete ventricosum]